VNHFLKLAEQQVSAPALRLSKKAEKAIAERRTMFRIWRKGHVEQHQALLAGPHGEALHELISFLDSMTLSDAEGLLSRAERWSRADAPVRFEVLNLIDMAIVSLREDNDLPPFDDALPGEPPSAFLIIREMLS
jgi:hypothetical protein